MSTALDLFRAQQAAVEQLLERAHELSGRIGQVQAQVDARANKEGITNEQAKINLLSEKQPSQEFVTPEQLGGLVVFLCSEDANEVRGVAWNMDGGWVAQ